MCAAPVAERVAEISGGELRLQVCNPELESYLPFIREGVVSLVGGAKQVRVKILCDTGTFDSFIVTAALPFSDKTDTGAFIPVRGMGMTILCVPRHKMMLSCELFQGEVAVVVRPALPLEGIQMIMGNDIAGSRVWSDVPHPASVGLVPGVVTEVGKSEVALPLVAPTPLVSNEPDRNAIEFPGVCRVCGYTRNGKCTVE